LFGSVSYYPVKLSFLFFIFPLIPPIDYFSFCLSLEINPHLNFMLKTIFLLILGLIVLPLVAWNYDAPLSFEQKTMLFNALRVMVGVALLCFITGEITGNVSQTDKLWSIMPIAYTWYFAWAGYWDVRMVLMAVLATAWGLRLSYNFWRRGGYHWMPWRGEEDYRWAVLRKMPLLQGRLRWGLFNLFFICFYQQGLILLFTLPAVMAWYGRGEPLNGMDIVATLLLLALLVFETIADQQQYRFQTEKYRLIAAKEPLSGEFAEGFCHSGLWTKIRHPNYAAEQGIWLAFYLFSVAATGRWINGSLVGAVLLMLLFQGSSDFSEKISAGKYPGYREYQRKTGRFIPKITGR
jgi:steroid 5-alpha reductase family enzyme